MAQWRHALPREVLPSLLHLTPAWLKARGLKGVILDLDNTLLPYGEGDLPEAYRAWLSDLKGAVPVYLLSNALPERFARVQRLLDLPGHAPPSNPGSASARRSKPWACPPGRWRRWGTRSSPMSSGATWWGPTPSWSPLREQEFFYTRFIRMLEAPFRRPRGGVTR